MVQEEESARRGGMKKMWKRQECQQFRDKSGGWKRQWRRRVGNVGGDTSDLGSEASLASELEMLDEISFAIGRRLESPRAIYVLWFRKDCDDSCSAVTPTHAITRSHGICLSGYRFFSADCKSQTSASQKRTSFTFWYTTAYANEMQKAVACQEKLHAAYDIVGSRWLVRQGVRRTTEKEGIGR
ncbi:hypothetical protein C343_06414 [Cryptococcus neoformans C23]|uniref:Uncharacterized protein n=1 Tax=Cryptococcus neoformans Tu259-1 TaxID=1230072 RepID=A0A854Q5K0_CRYNE|nr:hypothetical protein C347_06413 [Cryptococcus neoformans var. grubii AD2-60a]OWZ28740.1 hypothetical protein C353_06437 [Cryptococcus neoformans var. grubii AD1-83a]OWZ39206.1 hypothetical protein C343_06414 [Cryptococcus neoformans var. grubii C23]OWZ50537.1 hypothetical protein C368_06680 [Cryptococcus neoformans var. grubii 125.91]OXC81398.1 hypothetical protein C344_06318 [Cryptococcus neoformans var. grubii AD1-7a]OXG11509.1 hypothetical protein C361_06614 [Cryptococcus neoformans var.